MSSTNIAIPALLRSNLGDGYRHLGNSADTARTLCWLPAEHAEFHRSEPDASNVYELGADCPTCMMVFGAVSGHIAGAVERDEPAEFTALKLRLDAAAMLAAADHLNPEPEIDSFTDDFPTSELREWIERRTKYMSGDGDA